MQSLLFVLAVISGLTVAYPTLSDQTVTKTYPITSSEYLKMVFGMNSGMMAMTIPMVAEGDVVFLLKSLHLVEAAKMAEQINLKEILMEARLKAFTMLAPTDTAVKKWKMQVPELAADVDMLTRLCKAWIVPKAVRSSDIVNEMVVQSMYGAPLRFNIYDQTVTVNGAPIIQIDHPMMNGIVHVVDRVIFPLPDGDVFQTLAKVSTFSKFVELVMQADLRQELATTDAMTVCAPMNEAFAMLPAGVMADLVADKTKLQKLIKYHLMRGTRYSAGLANGQQIEAMAGGMINVSVQDGEIYLNKMQPDQPAQARVMHSDLPATNGVIHVVDHVLVPPAGHFILEI